MTPTATLAGPADQGAASRMEGREPAASMPGQQGHGAASGQAWPGQRDGGVQPVTPPGCVWMTLPHGNLDTGVWPRHQAPSWRCGMSTLGAAWGRPRQDPPRRSPADL